MALDRALGWLLLVGAAGGAVYVVWRGQSGAPALPPPGGAPEPSAPAASGPRGIRNNNPGNITASLAPWRGQKVTDGRYIVFETPVYGLRAIYRLLGNYHLLYGIDTIAKIAARWAPAPENNPAAYATNVANFAGIAMNQPLDFNSFEQMTRVARGIIAAENGAGYVNHYPAALFQQAWAIRGL